MACNSVGYPRRAMSKRCLPDGTDASRRVRRVADAFIMRSHRRMAFVAGFLAASVVAMLAGALPPAVAVVSYCREPTPHSLSSAQGETLCRLEGEYSYRPMEDKSTDIGQLYADLGSNNENRRFSPITLDANLIAKYVNYSDYALLVQVDSIVANIWQYHCCQVCTIDCAPSRYVCPAMRVAPNATCEVGGSSEIPRCRFGEELVEVRARLLCAAKVSVSHSIPERWWQPGGMRLVTSWRNCPYRDLAVNRSYLLMATAGTPLYGGQDGVTGADIVVSMDAKRESRLPESYFRRTNLEKIGYNYLIENATTGKHCPLIKEIRRLSANSGEKTLQSTEITLLAAAVAAAAATVQMLLLDDRFSV